MNMIYSNQIQEGWNLAGNKAALDVINADTVEWAENESEEEALVFAKSVGKKAFSVDGGTIILFAVNEKILMQELMLTIKQ